MSTIPSFSIAKLTVDDIAEINRPDTLHVVDFRATGETLHHEIASMFIYENLSQWLPSMIDGKQSGKYVTNSRDLQRNDVGSDIIVATPKAKASLSVTQRIGAPPKDIKHLWVAIPHPDFDRYAASNKLAINYTYDDFLRYNDKISQKRELGNLTPNYFEISDHKDLREAARKPGYIKAAHGAGGFSVLSTKSDADKITDMTDAIVSGKYKWYYEAIIVGAPHSVQLYKRGDSYILFGFAEQYMDGTNYIGARLLDVTFDLKNYVTEFVWKVCEQIHPLLQEYDGFFGIDLMIDGVKLSVLELNVRLTATTIPTLLANATGSHLYVEYFEEVPIGSKQTDDVVLAQSQNGGEVCLLRFTDRQAAEVGKNAYIQLADCQNLPKYLKEKEIERIKAAVEKSVSLTVAIDVKNFWPYGWTLSFILAESHCVLSSWHAQKNIFIDVFCCAEMNLDKFTADLSSIFGGKVVKLEVDKRATQ